MKLDEILGTNKAMEELVARFFRKYVNDESSIFFEVNSTGVDADAIVIRFPTGGVGGWRGSNTSEKFKKLPFKFESVRRSFLIYYNDELETLEGCPSEVGGSFQILGCTKITSLEHCTPLIGGAVDIRQTGITSLVGIHEHIKKMHGAINASLQNIKEGGIGILLIDGCAGMGGDAGYADPDWVTIIEKYLGRPDDIFECQAELIDAGFEAYAQL